MKFHWSIFLICCSFLLKAQENTAFTQSLYETYGQYKQQGLDIRRIKHLDILPLIKKYRDNPKFVVQKVGESIEGRSLNLISVGTGETDVFLWSQMHGNESTATEAIFDILNFLDREGGSGEARDILLNLRIHFLPMLNPDGAEYFTRFNALGIDVNRDAVRLQSPEGQTLKRIRDSLQADFGFNLHDQSTYYNAERTPKPATISYLAPAYNYAKDINTVRGNAMKVIVYMNKIIQRYAPGQVGRYNDDFEPRAFGDNIQKWGTSAILIESGGYPDDVEKQQIRKLNYVSILSALYTIAQGTYMNIPVADYEKIPQNDRKLFDLKIIGATYRFLGKDYVLDLGIQRQEVDNPTHTDFYYKSMIVDQGDLSTYYGYETFDATGYTIVPPQSEAVGQYSKQVLPYLQRGTAFLRTTVPPKEMATKMPMNLITENYKLPKFRIGIGLTPNFFLEKNGKLTHAVINGFLIDLSKPLDAQATGLIYRP